MAKILSFRNKNGSSSGEDFLTDENQTLSFRMSEDGAVSLGNMYQSAFPGLFPDPRKDWSNQELADLFRVRQLLSSANVPVETDRGVTDEGDPWFVFCHVTGEVFIHLCRIEGAYLLDSPNVLRPLRGADFNELIADFTNQALPAKGMDDDDSERRVIRLERGGKIRLHPSAMLAALIWTLFLASEELVLLAPDVPVEDDTDALLDFDGLFAVQKADDRVADMLFGDENTPAASHVKDDAHSSAEHGTSETQIHMREALQQQQGLTVQNNAFTMGLSTIAIAMGFMSETVLLDNQRKVLASLKELGFSEYGADAQQTAELDIPADGEGSALLEMLADFLGLDLSLNTDLADAPVAAETVEGSQLQQDLSDLADTLIDTQNILATVNLAAIRNKQKDANASAEDVGTPSRAVDTLAHPAGEDTLSAEAAQDTTTLTLSQIVQGWKPAEMEEYRLGQTIIKINFDMSDTDAFALFNLIDTTSQRTTNFREFDDMAQRLIDYLSAKSGELGIIELANEILMIDRTAVTGGEIEYMHWETSDGTIISIVGLASDFQQFDMIA